MRQTDGKYTGYQDGDLLMCVDCGSKAQRADWPGEGGICASASNGDAVCDACEDARELEPCAAGDCNYLGTLKDTDGRMVCAAHIGEATLS